MEKGRLRQWIVFVPARAALLCLDYVGSPRFDACGHPLRERHGGNLVEFTVTNDCVVFASFSSATCLLLGIAYCVPILSVIK